jgi:hypothetical protein
VEAERDIGVLFNERVRTCYLFPHQKNPAVASGASLENATSEQLAAGELTAIGCCCHGGDKKKAPPKRGSLRVDRSSAD